MAFSAGVVAAIGQATIPFYIGKAIDFASLDPDVKQFQHGALMLVSAVRPMTAACFARKVA